MSLHHDGQRRVESSMKCSVRAVFTNSSRLLTYTCARLYTLLLFGLVKMLGEKVGHQEKLGNFILRRRKPFLYSGSALLDTVVEIAEERKHLRMNRIGVYVSRSTKERDWTVTAEKAHPVRAWTDGIKEHRCR